MTICCSTRVALLVDVSFGRQRLWVFPGLPVAPE
jgi:hypothetical protein